MNVARVSFVQGSVQLLAGQGTDFQQAVMNMPVVDGSRLQTGGDGQAEVEFGDGSVARLTPNSALQFDHLGQDQVQLQQLGGLGYYEFNVGDGHPPFSVQFANLTCAADRELDRARGPGCRMGRCGDQRLRSTCREREFPA